MSIYFHSEQVSSPVFKRIQVRQWLLAVASAEHKSVENINIIFCSDDYLLKVNQDYLNHDYYTDIITFDYSEGKRISGDLFISKDRVKDNAIDAKETFSKELKRVMVHGVLHLCGYKDKTQAEQKAMRAKEDFYLSKIN